MTDDNVTDIFGDMPGEARDAMSPEQRKLAREFGQRLMKQAHSANTFMSPHAVATAMLSVGVTVAMTYLSREDAAVWLQQIAEGVFEGDDDQKAADEPEDPAPRAH